MSFQIVKYQLSVWSQHIYEKISHVCEDPCEGVPAKNIATPIWKISTLEMES